MIESILVSSFWGYVRDGQKVIHYIDSKLKNQSPTAIILTSSTITILAIAIFHQMVKGNQKKE